MKKKSNPPMKPPVLKVVWEDAWSNNMINFTSESFAQETPLILTSCGYPLQNDKRGIGLAQETRFDGIQHCYRHVTFIPRACIKKVYKLKG